MHVPPTTTRNPFTHDILRTIISLSGLLVLSYLGWIGGQGPVYFGRRQNGTAADDGKGTLKGVLSLNMTDNMTTKMAEERSSQEHGW